jgi:acetyl esterase/lipase
MRYGLSFFILVLACTAGCYGSPPSSPEKSAAAATVTAEPPPPLALAANSVVTRDLQYVEKGDAVLQSLDVYAPREAKAAPVVLFVHGGSWTHGDKAEVGSQPKLFNGAGIILVAVNYRFSPAVQHPAHVQDVSAAIGWTRKNIAKYGGDPAKIFVMGHSAGVLMAALPATDPRQLSPYGMKPADLGGAILLDGSVLDIPERIQKGGEKLAENCRRAFGPDPAVQADASAINHLTKGNSYPPFLLVYAKEGSLNHSQSKDFREKLTALGGSAEILHSEGKTHASLVEDLGTDHDMLGEKLTQFINSRSAQSPAN